MSKLLKKRKPYAHIEKKDDYYAVFVRETLLALYYVHAQSDSNEFSKDQLARSRAELTAQDFNDAFRAGVRVGRTKRLKE